MFSAFGDITVDEDANLEACKFIRNKISEIVRDPRKAEILKPNDLYTHRPLCDSSYYHIFNRDNVDVVDLGSTPIESIVPQGIRTSDGVVHELDVLIFATGFDAIEGSYTRVCVSGRNGKSLRQHWQNGPIAFGGVACNSFPNMFIISGPQGPFANFPPVIESETDFIMACIEHAEYSALTVNGYSGHNASPIIEVSKEAEQGWIDLCDGLVQGSLFRRTASWIFGSNVAGRKATTNFYFGGLNKYREWSQNVIANGFQEFKLS